MARPRRIWYKGAVYHVMSRGNRRKLIFNNDSDYLRFLRCVKKIQSESGFKIHALCLMPNHFHMIIETGETSLSIIMQKILSIYVEGYNKKYSVTGHLFEGRYKAKLIEDVPYFLESSRYIHLNPVKANMVGSPEKFLYSSYCKYVNSYFPAINNAQKLIISSIWNLTETSRILGFFPKKPHERYRRFVESRVSHREQEQLIQKEFCEDDNWVPWERKKRG